jgi:hypothetical protein
MGASRDSLIVVATPTKVVGNNLREAGGAPHPEIDLGVSSVERHVVPIYGRRCRSSGLLAKTGRIRTD